MPASASMTSVTCRRHRPPPPLLFQSRHVARPPRRSASSPAPARPYLGYQLDRPQDEWMRRIDRMRLNGQVGGAGQYRVGSQRRDHVIRVADMDVHCRDLIVHRHAFDKDRAANGCVADPLPRETDLGKPQRLRAVVRDEHGTRGENAGRAIRRQGSADRRRSSGSGCRAATGAALRRPAAACATASAHPPPHRPAGRLPR